MTDEAYAKANGLSPDEVGNRFAASGILRCPGGASGAQVTGARDVITTVAHAFRHDCKLRTPPDKCTFEYYRGAEIRTVPLSATLWMGTCIDSAPRRASGDWAVAKLDFPAEVTPYEIYERAEILVSWSVSWRLSVMTSKPRERGTSTGRSTRRCKNVKYAT
jgi:hypothetical protein